MKIKKILLCVILCLAMVIAIMPKTQAARLVINFSESTVNVGDTVTVTVTGDVTDTVNLSASGDVTFSQNKVSLVNGSASVTATIKEEGSIRITATADDEGNTATGGTITVANTSSTSTSTSENTTNNSTTSTQESSNANLNNLGIRPNDFSGFSPEITTYNVTVPEEVESVEVYATAQDVNATISGIGNKTLAYGENALDVVVTAEDGTTKTYTIHVTREGAGETEGNTEVKNGLSNLTVGNLQLSPSFKTDIYEYTVKYIGEETSLDIQAVPTDPSYIVEILGNEDLKEGENTITVLVSDSEENNVATYQLTVNKSLVDEEALAREEEERQQQEQRKMLMIAGGMIVLILMIAIIIVIKRRRNKAYAEEFSGIPFAGINDEEDYYDDYDEYDDYNSDNQFDNYDDGSENEENTSGQEDDENVISQVDNTSEIHEQEENNKIDLEDSEEKREKERAKREFLNGYNIDNDSEDYKEEKTKRGRKKGKRFK